MYSASQKKRIGIDARLWDEKGIGRYIQQLIRGLVEQDTDNQRYVLFCLPKDASEIGKIIPEGWELVVVSAGWYSFAEQLILPWIFYASRLDLLHVPHFNVPILYMKPLMVTIHDLTHFSFKMKKASRLPGWLYELKHFAYGWVFESSLLKARVVITVSQYVKNELVSKYGLKEGKITVTYEAAQACRKVSSDQLIRVLSDCGVTQEYFYYIGNAHPHKNLEFLLSAFAEFRKKFPNTQLVLSGDDAYFWPRLKKMATYSYLADGVVFTGHVSDEIKDCFLSGAKGLVFASLSEGFGLPMLEAMVCGCLVLAANATCLPEIGGDAALYFDPKNQESLVEVMEMVFIDQDLRKRMSEKGTQRAAEFSWTKMVEETKQLYLTAVG